MMNDMARVFAGKFHIFLPPEDGQVVDARRLGKLVDRWLVMTSKGNPDALAGRRAEKALHAAIKEGSFYGKILSFAGLLVWVDDRTSDGRVNSQEAINL